MHTSAPWTQEPKTKNKKDEGCYISAGNPGDLRLIAFVYATDDRQENARLISQAPFLLLAAEEIRAEVANGLHQHHTGGMELLFQAIDQATGAVAEEILP